MRVAGLYADSQEQPGRIQTGISDRQAIGILGGRG
jgi:hypothetical protein